MKNKFVFVSPMWNASKTLPQMLFSLYGQSYPHWNLILIDDVSSIDHREKQLEIIQDFNAMNDKIKVLWNVEKKWETANVLKGISMCADDDVICRIDADDFLCDLDALRIINMAYEQSGCDCLWTSHRWFDDDDVTSRNISGPMPDDADPYAYPWVSSHLKTFRKKLLNDVNDANFRGTDGEYIKRCGDQAVMLPVLKKSQKRLYFPFVTYAYRCDMKPATFQTDDAKFQQQEALFLRRRGYIE